MTTQSDQKTQTNIGFYVYLQAAHSELVARTHDAGRHKACSSALERLAAEDAGKDEPHMISPRTARSALAAFHLAMGAKPTEVAVMRDIAGGEPPSPFAVFKACAAYAMRGRYEPDTQLTADQWKDDEGLHVGATDAFNTFVMWLMDAVMTEQVNRQAGTVHPETGRIPTLLIQTCSYDDLFLDDIDFKDTATLLLTQPDSLATLVTGLAMVPAERRAAASAEVMRFANAAHIEDSYGDFAGIVDIAVAIYR